MSLVITIPAAFFFLSCEKAAARASFATTKRSLHRTSDYLVRFPSHSEAGPQVKLGEKTTRQGDDHDTLSFFKNFRTHSIDSVSDEGRERAATRRARKKKKKTLQEEMRGGNKHRDER